MAEPRLVAGRYQLDEPLGERPTRWLAHDLERDRTVVLTRVETGATGSASDEIAGRAGRPAIATVRALAGVDAASVLKPTEALLDGGELWVVRDHIDATPLTDLQLDERALAGVGAEVAAALVAAHGAGVVHGDVRAESVLVRPDGSSALAGFGTVAPRDVAPNALATAHPEPERVPGRPAGPAADVYALGAMLGAALERAGISPSERMAGALRTMRAEFADVRPTAWAAQQRLIAVATEPAPDTTAAPADPTRVRQDADNAATSIVVLPAAGTQEQRTEQVVRPAGSGGSDPRARAVTGRPWTAPQPVQGGGSPAGQWAPGRPPASGAPVPPQPFGTPPGGHAAPAAAGPGNAKRWILAGVAVLAALGIAAGAIAVAQPVVVLAGTGAAPPGTTPPPPSLLGDLHTADPCSLLDPGKLARVGRAQVLADLGIPSSCGVGINRDSGDYGYVTATIAAKKLSPPIGVPSKNGDLTIYKELEYQRSCQRTIVLPDEYRVEVYAGAGTNDTTFPVCDAADAATEDAVAVVSARKVGHRDLDFPRNSLMSMRACDVLDPAGLASVASLRSLRERGHNDWSCRYGADPSFPTGARVFVAFTRYSSLDGGSGVFTLDGRSANTFASTSGQAVCEAVVAQRSFTSSSGLQRIEVLSVQVVLSTDQPGASPTAACQKATDLTRSAIPRLPPTQ
jgi:hypothetical protein